MPPTPDPRRETGPHAPVRRQGSGGSRPPSRRVDTGLYHSVRGPDSDRAHRAASGPGPQDTGPSSGSRRAARRIGPYLVERELGRGSWGVVYLAQREGTATRYALKVLLDPLSADHETLARFEREARLPLQLQHPGIVRVVDAGRHELHPYYAMELCEGEDLKQRLARGPLRVSEALSLVAKLADALAYAHAHGVLHRDLKPANVLFDRARGEPLLTDFGFAKARSLSVSLTRSGSVFGTPFYMAPEAWRDAKHVDGRADVFALGVILYECLTGQRPFQGANPLQVQQAIERNDRPAPSRLAPGVSPALDALTRRALAHDPSERPDAAELSRELIALADGRTSTRRERALPAPATAPTPRRSNALVLGVAALLVATSGALAAIALRPQPTLATGPVEPAGESSAEPEGGAATPEQGGRPSLEARPPAPTPTPGVDRAAAERAVEALRIAARERASYETLLGLLDDAAAVAGDDPELGLLLEQERLHLAWRRGRYEDLERGARLALARSQLPRAWLRLHRARALFELGRQPESIELYRQLVANPRTDDPHELLAMAEVAVLQGQGEPAIQLAGRLLESQPDHVDARIVRARASMRADPRSAQDDLRRAAELSPDDVHIYFWWGLAAFHAGDMEAKADHLQVSIELGEPHPDDTALLWRGHTLWLLERYAEAEDDLDRLLDQTPGDLEGIVWRAGCWYAQGQTERANEAWRSLGRSRGPELEELLQQGGRRVEVRNLIPWVRAALAD